MSQPVVKPLADGSPLSGDRIRRNDGEVYDAARRVGLESLSKPRAMYPVCFFSADPPSDPALAGNVGISILGAYWPDRPVRFVRWDLCVINPADKIGVFEQVLYVFVGSTMEQGEGRIVVSQAVDATTIDTVAGAYVDTCYTGTLNERIGTDAVLRAEPKNVDGTADWFLTFWFTEDHDG